MSGQAVHRTMTLMVVALVVLPLLGLAGPAAASTWCGENGLVRFSFAEGDTIVESLVTGEPQGGVTVVDVTAWMTDMDPVKRRGDAFLRLGALEMKLLVTGAEATVIAQDFPDPRALNVGKEPGTIAVGFHQGLRCGDGYARLVHWKVMFKGRPRNVRFGLDESALPSCTSMTGCPGTGTQAIYGGADAANQLDCLFGAGYVPAWLNAEGTPDVKPVAGKVSWRDAGVFEAR